MIGIILMFVLFAILFYLSDTLEKVYDVKDVKKGLFLAIPLGGTLSRFLYMCFSQHTKVSPKWSCKTKNVRR
jgi:MFS transporter, ACDE family, multidrug resistance protein